MSLTTALQSESAKVITLVELTCGKTYPIWTVSGTYENVYYVSESTEVTAVKFNGTSMTYSRAYYAGENRWYWENNTLYICLPSGSSPNTHENTTQATLIYRFSNVAKEYSSRYYQARVESLPNLSFRVESDFQGLSQISGGTLTLSNGDGFFDGLNDQQWDAGTCTIRVGADTTSVMADEDYESVGVFSIVSWDISDQAASFRLEEIKERLKGQIPNTFYSKDTYPFMNDGDDGKPIQIAYGQVYGAEPVCINSKTGLFKLAGHPIWSVDSIRIETEGGYEEVQSASVDLANATVTVNAAGTAYPSTFQYASASVINLYISSVSGRFPDPASIGFYEVIYFNSTDYEDDPEADPYLVRMNVTATKQVLWSEAPSWTDANPPVSTATYMTVNIAPGTTIPNTTGKTYKITYRVWTKEKLSVDFKGKVKSDGYWMNNSADIVEDILSTYYSEDSFNAESFTEAARILQIGSSAGDTNEKVCSRVPGIYIDKLTSGLEVIKRVNTTVGSYLYINRDGEYMYKVFRPARGQDCATITEDEIEGYSEEKEKVDRPGLLRATYSSRVGEGWAQRTTVTRASNQYLANFPFNRVKEYETDLSTTSAADTFLQRRAIHEGRPRTIRTFSMRWRGFLFSPADQVRLQYSRRSLDAVLEVLEVSYDLGSKTVKMVCGDRRGVVTGWWVSASETFPASLADETGYNSGVLPWSTSWSDGLITYATQNIGYWLDVNGYADPTDGDSFMVSRWS